MNREYLLQEAIDYCFTRIKVSIIGKKDYNKFREYRRRYEKGTLSETGLLALLEYFGFKQESHYLYDSERDKSK